MVQYWVVGGEYKGTDFKTVVDDGREELIGPYAVYKDAYMEWQRRSWARVDNCHVRYRIVIDESDWTPPGFVDRSGGDG